MMEKYMRRVRSTSPLRQVVTFGALLSAGAAATLIAGSAISAQQPAAKTPAAAATGAKPASAGAAEAFKPEAGFTSLFDGKTLNGWQMVNQRGEGYAVKD